MEPAYVKRMRDLREDADLTQRDVARLLGTSQTMYARYERGANELPLRHLIALCGLYHVSADYLLGLVETRGQKKGYSIQKKKPCAGKLKKNGL